MKSLVLATVLVAHFHAGDCIAPTYLERWDIAANTYKILEVGKRRYHISCQGKNACKDILPFSGFDDNIATIDQKFSKVKCVK